MDGHIQAGVRDPRSDRQRPGPRRMTLADLCVIVAAVALVMAMPSRTAWWPSYLSSLPPLFFVITGGLRLTVGFGLVLALVLLYRHGLYGGPVRPAEWLALGLASLGLLDMVPKLDETVDAYHAAVGSNALDSRVARWLLSALAAAVVGLVAVALVVLRPRVRDGSRVASSLTILGIVAGLSLTFWGPCEVALLQLPWHLVPSPQAELSSNGMSASDGAGVSPGSGERTWRPHLGKTFRV
jgi:hypothetical protein